MRPFDGSKLEYSYRPLDNINQFWAGPSYWKIRSNTRKLMSDRSIFIDNTSQNLSGSTIITKKAIKRKSNNRNKISVIKFSSENGATDESRLSGDSDDSDLFISIDSEAAQKFKKNNVYKRWDSKRLKLPTDLRVDHSLFDFYLFCPSANIRKDAVENVTPANIDDDMFDSDHNDNEVSFFFLFFSCTNKNCSSHKSMFVNHFIIFSHHQIIWILMMME